LPPIVASAEIERPAAEVFAYATDPARFSEWQKGVVDGHMDGPPDGTPAPVVGAKCVTTRRIGGASRPSTSELTHIDPPRTWGVRGTDGPVRAAVEVLVEPLSGSRSRLTISVDFSGHGIGKILVPLMVRREARKEMPGNVAALKQKMEADSAANHRDLAGDGQDDV
jgi:uncharacterized protein YndB with AHSA1/START domain